MEKILTGVQYTRHLVDSYSYSSGSKEYGGAPTVSYDLGSEPCFVKFCKNAVYEKLAAKPAHYGRYVERLGF